MRRPIPIAPETSPNSPPEVRTEREIAEKMAKEEKARERELVKEFGDALGPLVITGADLLRDEPEEPTMIDGLAARGETLLVAGPEKNSLKTWLALALMLAVLSGRHWLGRRVARQTDPCLFLTETSFREVRRRLRMLAKGMGVDLGSIAHLIVIVTSRITLLPMSDLSVSFDKANLAARRTYDMRRPGREVSSPNEVAWQSVKARGTNICAIRDIVARAWSLVVVDTLRHFAAGDENSSEPMQLFADATREIADETNALVVIVHHTSKGTGGGEIRSARGSTAITGAVDGVASIDITRESRTMKFAPRCREPLPPISYSLVVDDDAARLEVAKEERGADIGDRVLAYLRAENAPRTKNQIREAVCASGDRIVAVLAALARARSIAGSGTGSKFKWSYVPSAADGFS